MARKGKSFEEAITRLEEIVNIMEEGDLSLDDTVRLYKEGVELAALCGGKLSDAKQEVTLLTAELDGQLTEKPFDIREE